MTSLKSLPLSFRAQRETCFSHLFTIICRATLPHLPHHFGCAKLLRFVIVSEAPEQSLGFAKFMGAQSNDLCICFNG